MNLLDVRDKLAATLAPALDTDPNVLTSLVDSIEPPALMLGWGEPWLRAETACFAAGRVIVTAVAARLVPGDGLATLESLVDYTLTRIRLEGDQWRFEEVTGPRVFVVAKTTYLACRISIAVQLGG